MRIHAPENDHVGPRNSRRSFCRAAAVCAGLPVIGCYGQSPDEAPSEFAPLREGDRVALEEEPEVLIQRAYDLGREYEDRYRGCAQCTVAALQDAIGLVPANNDVFLAASCLDGGATPTARANCGAFTGSGMVIGHLCGRPRDRFDGGSELSHRLIRQVHDGLVEAFGSVLCGDIRAATNRDCAEAVGTGARLAAEAIISEFGEYTPRQA